MDNDVENGFDDMIEACQIFKKYDSSYAIFHCEHDEMSVCVDPSIVSEEDKKRLEELSFNTDEDTQRFYSFRFGSC